MSTSNRLLTVHETAEILHMNPEVVRRWLRKGSLKGTKVGSDWRVAESTVAAFLEDAGPVQIDPATQGPKMCVKFPKWLEYSGLPRLLNDELGPQAWPVFRKLIENDFERGDEGPRPLPIDLADLATRTGYEERMVQEIVRELLRTGYLVAQGRKKGIEMVSIRTPLPTPRLVLDIDFAHGGVRGAPDKAFSKTCVRRYLESP
jgi:excisionase family DNA binding protein